MRKQEFAERLRQQNRKFGLMNADAVYGSSNDLSKKILKADGASNLNKDLQSGISQNIAPTRPKEMPWKPKPVVR